MRWLVFVAGIVVLIGTWSSVLGTLVVTRGITSKISFYTGRSVAMIFQSLARLTHSYALRDRILAWQAGVTLLVRLAVWLGLLVLGYALVLHPLVPGSIGHSFSEAGSSIFTLGYSAPAGRSSTVVDYLASFSGLVVVGLQIGYLPTLYAAFNRREVEVTLLVSRAGVPAWGPELLARTRWGIYSADTRAVLDDVFTSWERWSAEVAESHTTYLTLVWMRSPKPLSHWLTSLIAVMDAAAMHLALAPDHEPKLSARLCLRSGFVAMNQIAAAMGLASVDDADPDRDISVSYDDFAQAVEMLRRLEYPMEMTVQEAWPNFRGWRVNYDAAALALAWQLDAPPAKWSGPRRYTQTAMEPLRPANRLPSETTET
ncbi:MAG: hypothetical protein J2P17_13800 [Mycobacterium sp.]|nr:hypothetical protein [Mycobacterium sp.]